jgi:hypothetical protein
LRGIKKSLAPEQMFSMVVVGQENVMTQPLKCMNETTLPEARELETVTDLLARRQLLMGHKLPASEGALSTGLESLDRWLPGGGYPRGEITELVGGAGLHRLIVSVLVSVSLRGAAACLARQTVPAPEVLAARGAHLHQIFFVVEDDPGLLSWAARQVVSSGRFLLVVLFGSDAFSGAPLLDPVGYRRLRGLARHHDVPLLLLLREHPDLAAFARPCALRLQVHPEFPENPHAPGVVVTIARSPGGQIGNRVIVHASPAPVVK